MLTTKLSLFCRLVATTLLLGNDVVKGSRDLQNDISLQIEKHNGTYLSRKRRYLVFPPGSSFQLVYCLTYSSVAVGSYFVFGHTAALAWELPSMPLFFDQEDFQNKEEEPAQTKTTEMPEDVSFSELDHNDYERVIDDGGEFSSWDHPHDNMLRNDKTDDNRFASNWRFHYNNPFGKIRAEANHLGHNLEENPNLEYVGSYSNKYFSRYDPKKSHMMLNMHPKYYQAHRRTRRDLYWKIESFLTTLNLDGKACLLKSICELSRSTHEKESFMEELLKAVFRVKPHNKYQDEDEYDAAANPAHNCTEMYSTCPGSIRNVQLLARK